MSIYDEVKKALQDILAPQLAEVRGEIAQVRAEVGAVRSEIDARFVQVDTRFIELRSEMAQLRTEMRQEVNNLHTDLVRVEQVLEARFQALGVLERVARLEERVGRT